jgi:hypothetical protein
MNNNNEKPDHQNDKQQKTNKKPKTTTNSQTVNTKPEKTKTPTKTKIQRYRNSNLNFKRKGKKAERKTHNRPCGGETPPHIAPLQKRRKTNNNNITQSRNSLSMIGYSQTDLKSECPLNEATFLNIRPKPHWNGVDRPIWADSRIGRLWRAV